MPIRLFVLGGLRAERDGAEVEGLASQRLRAALLVHLAIERVATRDALVAMFWPEIGAEAANHRLSQNVYALRTALGDDVIETRGRELRAAEHVEVDATTFADAHAAGRHADAVAHYGGPFLAGVHLSASHEFEAWADSRRMLHARQFRASCRALVDERLASGDVRGAVEAAQMWVAPDPLDDEAQHRLIEVLAHAGLRGDALEQYDAYARMLAADGLEPLDGTRTLRAEIEAMPVVASAAQRAPIAAAPPTSRAASGATTPPTIRWRPRWAVLVAVVALATVDVSLRRDGTGAPPPRRDDVVGVLPVQVANDDMGGLGPAFEARLSSELRDVRGLVLRAPDAISPYQARGWPLDSIGTTLSLNWFLKTLLSRARDSLVIDLQLIDADGQSIAGTVTLRAPIAADPFALLDSLGTRAAELVRRELGVEVARRSLEQGTDDARALMLRYEAEVSIRLARETLVRPGNALAFDRLVATAESELRQSAQLDPEWAEPTLRRAELAELRAHDHLLNTQPADHAHIRAMFDDGIAAANEVLRRESNHAGGLALRGRLRWIRALLGQDNIRDDPGLLSLAEADLRDALELDPMNARAAADLSELLHMTGDHAEAERLARKAYDHDRYLAANSSILIRLAEGALERGDDEEASLFCAEGRLRYPENPGHFACSLEVMAWGSIAPAPDSATAYFESLRQRVSPTNRSALEHSGLAVAAVLARAGLADSARAILTRTLADAQMHTDGTVSVFLLPRAAGVYLRLGDHAQARVAYDELVRRDADLAATARQSRVLEGLQVPVAADGPH